MYIVICEYTDDEKEKKTFFQQIMLAFQRNRVFMIMTNEAIYLCLNTKIVRKQNNYNEAFTSSNINLVLNEAMKHDFSSLSLCLHQLQKCFLIPMLRSIHNISSLKMNLNRLEMHLDERSKREMQIAHFKLLVRHISCHEMDATQSRVSIYTFKSYLYIANRHSSTSSGSTLSDQRNTRSSLDYSQIKFLL